MYVEFKLQCHVPQKMVKFRLKHGTLVEFLFGRRERCQCSTNVSINTT